MATELATSGRLEVFGADGGVEQVHPVDLGECEIGRAATGLACPDDAGMADRQACLRITPEGVTLLDLGHGSGVWLRLRGGDGRLLASGDQLWLGEQILVARRTDQGWQLRHHGPDGRLRDTHDVPPTGLLIGRRSDLPLDPADGQLSRRHAQVVPEGDALRVYDRGAHNGSFLRLREPEALVSGDEFRVASRQFRYVADAVVPGHGEPAAPTELLPDGEQTESALEDRTLPPAEPEPTEPALSSATSESSEHSLGLGARLRALGRRQASPQGEAQEGEAREEAPREEREALSDPSPAAGELALVVIDSDDGSVSLEVEVGGTVLDAVRAANLEPGRPVDWECGDGRCGVCILGVVEGGDRMDPPDPASGEMKTIQITEQVAPDPQRYRLACLARVRGTVRLRKLT